MTGTVKGRIFDILKDGLIGEGMVDQELVPWREPAQRVVLCLSVFGCNSTCGCAELLKHGSEVPDACICFGQTDGWA